MTRKQRKTHVFGGKQGGTCRDLLAVLSDYVDGNIDPALCQELESHLAHCNPCRVVVDNVRKTIVLYRQDEPCDLPGPFRKRLHAALRSGWKPAKPARKAPKTR